MTPEQENERLKCILLSVISKLDLLFYQNIMLNESIRLNEIENRYIKREIPNYLIERAKQI